MTFARKIHLGQGHKAALVPGHTVWRQEQCHRAKILIDAGAYFGALRAAMLNAQRSIYILAWDLDSRTALLDENGETPDGLPATLAAFLTELIARRPDLSVKLLVWNYSLLYAFERELNPTRSLDWNTPPQVELCWDSEIPLGSSHHQKIVVIDDTLAFSGGLDVTVRRWDNSDHSPSSKIRVDPDNVAYPPFHDVQIMVDGGAAKALAELVRVRWDAASCKSLPAVDPLGDPWPQSVAPDFTDIKAGISRTQPAYGGEVEIREIERLYFAMVRQAERILYIENQFLTCLKFAEELVKALRRNPGLEVVIVCPKTHHSWFEERTMLAGRIRFQQRLHKAGLLERVRILYPHTRDEQAEADVMVHAKVMIVDDKLLRVGSSNLCNRSMGTDTECDLTLKAESEAHQAMVRSLHHALLAEHCGATREEVQSLMDETGSLFTTLDRLAGRDKALRPIHDSDNIGTEDIGQIEALADPDMPIGIEGVLEEDVKAPGRGRSTLIKIALLAAALLAFALAWRYTPLSDFLSPAALQGFFERIAAAPWSLPLLLLLFIAGGLVAFPVTVLIAATALVFGLWPGLPYAALGALASATATYGLGRLMGAKSLRSLFGRRIEDLSAKMERHGILAMTLIRLVPFFPFSLVNLVAGALKIRLSDYLIGTALGLAPGLILLSALGGQLADFLTDPSPAGVALALLLLGLWIGVAFALQSLASRTRTAK